MCPLSQYPLWKESSFFFLLLVEGVDGALLGEVEEKPDVFVVDCLELLLAGLLLASEETVSVREGLWVWREG